MKGINLGLRFLLELSLLGAFGYWGFQVNSSAIRWLLGIGIPINHGRYLGSSYCTTLRTAFI